MSWRQFLLSVILVVCAGVSSTFAQEATVIPAKTVRVVNGSIPLPYAVCVNMTNYTAAVSNEEGYLTIPERLSTDEIEFRMIGYNTLIVLPGQKIDDEVHLVKSLVGIGEVLISTDKSVIGAEDSLLLSPKYVDHVRSLGPTQVMRPTNTSELLQSSGQVHVQQSQQGGGSPVIRGFEANRILLVVDGIRLNNAIYRSGHLQNSSTIDASMLEELEVVLGPNSVKYGSDALGGVLHFKTKNPRLDSKSRGEASVSYLSSNHGSAFRTTASTGEKKWGTIISVNHSVYGDSKMGSWRPHGDESWGLIPYYVTRQSGEDVIMENPDPEIQKNSGFSQTDFLQKFRFSIPGGTLMTNVQYSTTSNIPRFDRVNDLNSEGDGLKWARWEYGPQKRLMTALSWEQYALIPGTITTTVAYQDIQESRYKRRFNEDLTDVQIEDLDVLSFSSVWESSKFREDGWSFEGGVDGQWNELQSTTASPQTVSRYANDGSYMYSLGAFAAAKKRADRKTYHGGLRYSFSSIYAFFDLSPDLVELPFTEIQNQNGALTGSFSFDVKIRSNVKSTTSLSTGFRHPNIDDAAKIREKNGFVILPNDSLRAEYIYSVDESITVNPFGDKRLTLTAAAFVSLWADAIAPVTAPLNGVYDLLYDGEYATIQTNQNVGNATIIGARFEAQSILENNLELYGTINFTKGQIISSESPLSHIPPTYGKLSAKKKFIDWDLGAFILFNGAKNIEDYGDESTDNLSEALETGTPSWWTFNIQTSYKINDDLKAQLGIDNVFDMHYKPFASGISAPGRGLYVRLNANF